MICVKCKENPVFIKKHSLCQKCYHHQYRKERKTIRKVVPIKYNREINFIKNFFNHMDWIYEPAKFNLEGLTYTPDFYDKRRNVFIEVVGTRQAYEQGKAKYLRFLEKFPSFNLEFRCIDGSLLERHKKTGRIKWNGNDAPDNK